MGSNPIPPTILYLKLEDRITDQYYMKECSRCHENKPVIDFNKNKKSKDGFQSRCRSCQSKHHSEYHSANHDAFKERRRKLRKNQRKWLAELKNHPCMDCKRSFPPHVMDFDHRDGETKAGNVSRMILNASKKTVLTEIAKCDIVCANCHRDRTWKRGLEA